MAILEYTNTNWTLELEYAGTDIYSIVSKEVRSLIRAIYGLHEVVSLSEFKLEQESANEYTYSFLAQDGREWEQTIQRISDQYYMNFEIPDFWFLEEFKPHRVLRTTVIELIENNGLIKVEATFNN